ncbi:MAG: S41 family peptidase [Bacteroidota bacterium]
MRNTRTLVLAGCCILLVGLLLGMQVRDAASSDDPYQNLKKLEEAYSYVTRNYVDRVDSADLAEDAILGMIEGLDPHSVYIDAEEMRSVRENFDASFQGIGIYYEFIDGEDDQDTLAVLRPIVGGPSEEAGLEPGDRILTIDDTTALGFSTEEVQRYLKGPKGTRVDVTVRRRGFRDPLAFTITRDDIPLNTLVAAHMVDDETGYIKLQRFARSTYDEFMTAMNDLSDEGMERLVLDLRGNVGGYMDQAVKIVDEFLPNDEMIVYTDSRHVAYNREYTATPGGSFEGKPLIVLVDENSASASEIVAGAVQDHDRAVIVGRRTFGKGLVQQQFQLNDGAVLQMTISRYFTPSGRLIQTAYERGAGAEDYYEGKLAVREGEIEAVEESGRSVLPSTELAAAYPDSLRFETDAGRDVFGGGGILPDYVVVPDSAGPTLRTVIRQSLDSQFARDFLDGTPAFRGSWGDREREFIREYRLSDDLWTEFLAYADAQGVPVVDEATEDTEESVFVEDQLARERGDVEARIKAFLARRLYGVDAFYPVIQNVDRTFQEALLLWPAVGDLADLRASVD